MPTSNVLNPKAGISGFDAKGFVDALAALLGNAIRPLVESGASDLAVDGMAYQLADLAKEAIITGDEEVLMMCKKMVPLFAQIYRLKAINAGNDVLMNGLELVMSTVSKLLGSLPLGGLIPLLNPVPTPTKKSEAFTESRASSEKKDPFA